MADFESWSDQLAHAGLTASLSRMDISVFAQGNLQHTLPAFVSPADFLDALGSLCELPFENSESSPCLNYLLSGELGLTAALRLLTGNFFNHLSKTPMFLMFSTAPASTMTNVYKGFTDEKSDHPMFIGSLTGLRV